MNRNITHATKVIRSGLEKSGDVAQAIAFDLQAAGLLVDPERTYGIVMQRTPEGTWAPARSSTAPVPEPEPTPEATAEPLTELEQQAAAWDLACARAADLAARLQRHNTGRAEVLTITPDYDRVVVALHVTALDQWEAWLQEYEVTPDRIQSLGYAAVAAGHVNGIEVRLVGHDVPELQAAAAAALAAKTGGAL